MKSTAIDYNEDIVLLINTFNTILAIFEFYLYNDFLSGAGVGYAIAVLEVSGSILGSDQMCL